MRSTIAAILLLAPALATFTSAAPVQWPIASGGNGHYYERVDKTNLTFSQATTAASARSFAGFPGRLLILETPTYAAEFNFVFDHVYVPGVVSERAYWVGAFLPASGPWRWLDGSPANTGGWVVDHFEGPGDEGGTFFRPSSRSIWDYIATNSSGLVSGYVVEYATCPADLNNDAQVDDADFSIFIVGYNILDCADPAMPQSCPADLNHDGLVDDADFVAFVAAYNALLCS